MWKESNELELSGAHCMPEHSYYPCSCNERRYSHGNPYGEHNQRPPRELMVAAVERIQGSPGFRRQGGANYVFLESHPGGWGELGHVSWQGRKAWEGSGPGRARSSQRVEEQGHCQAMPRLLLAGLPYPAWSQAVGRRGNLRWGLEPLGCQPARPSGAVGSVQRRGAECSGGSGSLSM